MMLTFFKMEEIQTMPHWQSLHNGDQHPGHNLQMHPTGDTIGPHIHLGWLYTSQACHDQQAQGLINVSHICICQDLQSPLLCWEPLVTCSGGKWGQCCAVSM